MGCPSCGHNEAYESPFKGWSCVNNDCTFFDDSTNHLKKVAEQKSNDTNEFVAARRFFFSIQKDEDGDTTQNFHHDEEEAWRYLCDCVMDRLDDDDVTIRDADKREILNLISNKLYWKAVHRFNINQSSYKFDVEGFRMDDGVFSNEPRLENRSVRMLQEMEDEEEDLEEEDDTP